MALLTCPVCDREIGDADQACPHCGFTMTREVYDEESATRPASEEPPPYPSPEYLPVSPAAQSRERSRFSKLIPDPGAIFLMVVVVSGLVAVSIGYYKPPYSSDSPPTANVAGNKKQEKPLSISDLPPHTVEITPLDSKGNRVRIDVQVDFLPKAECSNLINFYKDRAKPKGQITINGPSPESRQRFPNDPSADRGQVWAYFNFDGKGIVYNDSLYVPVE